MTSTAARTSPGGAEPGSVPGPDLGCGEGVEADLGWAMATTSAAFRRWATDSVADLPGGPRGYLILAAVSAGQPRSQLALAQRLGVDKTAMTYLLDGLEGAGLVTRRPDPADRRARQVVITAAGARTLARARQQLEVAETRLLAALSPAEAASFRRMLGLVARSVQSEGANCGTSDGSPAPPCA